MGRQLTTLHLMYLISGEFTPVTENTKLGYLLLLCRRRSVQFHYAASECKPTKCPKAEEEKKDQGLSDEDKPHYFDCDPSCQEPEYWYYRKAELLVCGQDFGGEHI